MTISDSKPSRAPKTASPILRKVAILLCAFIIGTSVLLSFYSLSIINELSNERITAGFIGDTELISESLVSAFTEIRNDSLVLVRMPPFQGLARSMANNDVDPFDNSTTDLWERRLQITFESMLVARPFYTQLRFISLADNGQELVRVDREDDSIYIVQDDGLQEKGDEFYFQEAIGLQQGQIYYSDVTRNREFGITDESSPYTFRAIQGIYNGNGEMFGMFVINVHYENLLTDILESLSPEYDTFIADNYDNFAHFIPDQDEASFTPATNSSQTPTEVEIIHDFPGNNMLFQGQIDGREHMGYVIAANLGGLNQGLVLRLGQFAPSDQLLQEAARILNQAIIITALIVVVSLFFALNFSYRLSQPLIKIRQAVLAYGKGEKHLDLPTDRKDEIGDVARSFDQVINRIEVLRETERDALAKVEASIENAADGLITVNTGGEIISTNPAARKVFGFPEDKIISQNISVIIPAMPGLLADKVVMDTSEFSGKNAKVFEVNGLSSNGNAIPIDISISKVVLSNDTFFWLVIRDISWRKSQEGKLLDAMDELKHINQELDDFTHIASHDLREPMRGIQIHAQSLVNDYVEKLDENGARKLNRINELCGRMQLLITNLLEYSRIGRTELERSPESVEAIIQESVDSLKSLITEKNVNVILKGKFPTLSCDKPKIQSVFMNLIVNGIKYNKQDNIEIEIGFLPEYTMERLSRKNVFYVRDNGIGIHSDFFDDIFTIFKRLNNEKVFGYGTGSGLTFVKKIIEQHNGRVWVESEVEKGTTFLFTLGDFQDENY